MADARSGGGYPSARSHGTSLCTGSAVAAVWRWCAVADGPGAPLALTGDSASILRALRAIVICLAECWVRAHVLITVRVRFQYCVHFVLEIDVARPPDSAGWHVPVW